jgi:hypothetical protein
MMIYYIILFTIIFLSYLFKKMEILLIISFYCLLQFILINEIYIDNAIEHGLYNEIVNINNI